MILYEVISCILLKFSTTINIQLNNKIFIINVFIHVSYLVLLQSKVVYHYYLKIIKKERDSTIILGWFLLEC